MGGYRWCGPGPGEELPAFVAAELADHAGRIIAHPRDAAALRGLLLAGEVVEGSPAAGLPLPGTVWIVAEEAGNDG